VFSKIQPPQNVKHRDLWEQAWQLIQIGIRHRQHDFHYMTVATPESQQHINLSTVICRYANPQQLTVGYHTDQRKTPSKLSQSNPPISLLWYSPLEKIQVRARGQMRIHHQDDVCETVWQGMSPLSKRCYAKLPSGESCANKAFEHFCVIRAQLEQLEYFRTSIHGNLRICFRAGKSAIDSENITIA